MDFVYAGENWYISAIGIYFSCYEYAIHSAGGSVWPVLLTRRTYDMPVTVK